MSDISISKFITIGTIVFMVVAGCVSTREFDLVIEVCPTGNVTVSGMATHIRQLSSQINVRKIPPKHTKVIFCCAKESKHHDLLMVQRYLSTLGYYNFNIDIGQTSIPVMFGPLIDANLFSETNGMSFRIDISKLGNEMDEFCTANLGNKVQDFLETNKNTKVCFEVYCSGGTNNSTLQTVLCLLQKFPNVGIYIVSF